MVGARPDGKIGPATLAATRVTLHADVIHKLCDNRMAFLKRARGSSGAMKGKLLWPTFGKGWTRRVTDVRRHTLELVARPTSQLAACSLTAPASECDGWRKLIPAAQTRAFIIEHDRPFAESIAAHNGFGAHRGCWQ